MSNEDELIAMCKRGNPAAYTGLYNEHSGAVYNTILRLVKHTAEAEDILQESFVAAFQGIAGYTPAGGFRAWIKRIAINKSIDWIRKQKINFLELEPHLLYVTEEEMIDGEEFQFTMDDVAAAIELLPGNYRTIFNLYVVENIPQVEIAQMLGLKNSIVRIQYYRARKKLISLLTKAGCYAK